MSARHCLLVFDNVEDINLRPRGSSTSETTSLSDYFPELGTCSVILTTTQYNVARVLAPQNIVELRNLIPSTALAMLQSRLSISLSDPEQQEAAILLRDLSYLPLAIMQAAACIMASGLTIQEYRSRLSQYQNKNAAPIEGSVKSIASVISSGTNDPVATTLLLSMAQVSRENASAVDCLFLAACVDPADISLEYLSATSAQDRQDAVKVLDKYALVTRRPDASSLDVHRLVHEALRKELSSQEKLEYWTRCSIENLSAVFPEDDYSNRSKWRRLLPHAEYVLSQGVTDTEDDIRQELACKCAKALYNDGRYTEAERLEVEVMEWRKRVLGLEHTDALISMANLALTMRSQGRLVEAEEMLLEVMDKFQRGLGGEHPSTLITMASLASIYRPQARWTDAEELDVRVATTSSKILGDEHPDTLSSIANLASTYWNQGRWKEAEELEVQVITTSCRVLGHGHPHTLISKNNLASTYRSLGRLQEAEEMAEEVVEASSRVLGPEHLDTLSSMAHLALTYKGQEQWQKAEEMGSRVLKARRKLLGDYHPDTLDSMHSFAHTIRMLGRYDESLVLIERCAGLCEQTLGVEHPHTREALDALNSWRADCVTKKSSP